MSLWKWNDVELEIDMEDVEFQERYENAFQHLEEKENKLVKTGKLSEISKSYCLLFWELYDEIFGEGTAQKLFNGKMNTGLCDDCYDSFINHCQKQVNEINKKRSNRFAKYKVKR